MNRTPFLAAGFAALAGLAPGPSSAQPRPATETRYVPFEACLARIAELAESYGTAATPLVATDTVRMVQFRAPEASVVLICNKADGSMITTVTPRDCGTACQRRPFAVPPAQPGAR